MNTGFVLDSSVAIACSVESQSSPETKALLDKVGTGVPFVVPVLWPFEVANTLLILMRRKHMTQQDYLRARLDFQAARPVIDAVRVLPGAR